MNQLVLGIFVRVSDFRGVNFKNKTLERLSYFYKRAPYHADDLFCSFQPSRLTGVFMAKCFLFRLLGMMLHDHFMYATQDFEART